MSYEALTLFKLYIITAPLMFLIGIYAVINTRNIIAVIIGLEIMTKGATIFLAAAGFFAGRQNLMEPLIITVIVLEVVVIMVACGYIVNIAKAYNSIDTKNITKIKG
jgi:NADH:ubiquinone oxidoreductase subunit K